VADAPVKSVSLTLDGGMRVEDSFAAIARLLAQFQSNLPGVLASGDIEYVHQAGWRCVACVRRCGCIARRVCCRTI